MATATCNRTAEVSVRLARSTAVLHPAKAIAPAAVVSGCWVADETAARPLPRAGPVIGPGDRADHDPTDQRHDQEPKTVEAHVHSIFTRLDLHAAPDDHRRVLAVLAFLRA